MLITPNHQHEGSPESIRPFWVSREPVAWPWCTLAASQRRPYCTPVNSHCPVGLVSRQWDAVDWACVRCERPIRNDRAIRSTSSRQSACPFYSSRADFFWQNIISRRFFSPPTAQFWLPAAPGFSQNWNRRWKGGDLWMRRSLCIRGQSTASHCRLTSPTGEWLFMDAQ